MCLCVCVSPTNSQPTIQTEFVSLPYFGAAKGHVLEITRDRDGLVSTKIVQEQQVSASSVADEQKRPMPPPPPANPPFFYGELADIQKATADILALNDRIRLNERLTKFDHQLYMDHLKKLNEAGTMVVNGAEQPSPNGKFLYELEIVSTA